MVIIFSNDAHPIYCIEESGTAMSRTPIRELMNANAAIERHLASSGPRGEMAQDVMSHLRHLTEHLAMAIVNGKSFTCSDYYSAIRPALNELPKMRGMKFLWEFHELLQKSVSHYSLSQDDAQRLLVKYKEYLVLCRELAKNKLGIDILLGLGKVNWDDDPGLQEYYDLIFDKVATFGFGVSSSVGKDRYYVYSRKAVFSKGHLFYEYSLVPAMNFTSKFDHVIAFSQDRIPTNYSIQISVKRSSIPALDRALSIMIVDGWETSIRPCEINKLLKLLGSGERISGGLNSYKRLMRVLTESKMSLLDLCTLPYDDFTQLINSVSISGKNAGIQQLLERSRPYLLSQRPGSNVLRYLLYRPRHVVIESQVCDVANPNLSNLWLYNGCIPFDKQPFCTSLLRHSPTYRDLAMCINPDGYEDNFLARAVGEKENNGNCVFIDQIELEPFHEADNLTDTYNRRLYSGHTGRKLVHEMGQFFFKEAEDDLAYIIMRLLELSRAGVPGYRSSSMAKINGMNPMPDDEKKIEIAANMFDKSNVALLYGSAGTGKTTLVNIICDLFASSRKIAIANTNPAVYNLRRRIKDALCDCMTVSKYLLSDDSSVCDLLIVDECSTVSNSDMKKVLERGGFKLLLLVGDIRQIESIRLGNWFDIAKDFLGEHATFQLEKSWRSANSNIKKLWDSVRMIEDDIAEKLASCGASSPLCENIFDAVSEDEIILCLNYDGLYGINNINRMLQSANQNEAISWGLQTFKVGDPVLFNESGRFAPVLHNNLKGRLSNLELVDDDLLHVEVVVDMPLNSFEVMTAPGLQYIESYPDGSTRIAFDITQDDETDDGDAPKTSVVPFQIAYAVSIHKAQGLEYDSVKIVVTKDVESRVTHSIFYTAITRAKNHLTVFWSPETQKTVIERFVKPDNRKDARLIANRKNIKLRNAGSRADT